jgi:hypothetical protein
VPSADTTSSCRLHEVNTTERSDARCGHRSFDRFEVSRRNGSPGTRIHN